MQLVSRGPISHARLVAFLLLLLLGSCGYDEPGLPAASPTASPEHGQTAAIAGGTATAPPAAQTPTPRTTVAAPTAAPVSGGISHELPAAEPPSVGFPSTGTRTKSGIPQDPAFVPLEGAEGYHGRLGDAAFRVEFPAGWAGGGMVLWAHGFRTSGEEIRVSSPPRALREAILSSGFGWAASSFSENGYVPGLGADDTLALKVHLEQEFGSLGPVIIAGQSMGGNVTVLSLESFPGVFAAGLSYCGAVGGIEELDFLLSWGLLAEYFTGIHLPVGEIAVPALAPVVQMGILLGAPESPTSRGVGFASAVRELTGGPRPFFSEGFREQYTANFGLLVVDSERLTVLGGSTSNLTTVYGVDATTGIDAKVLNAEIRRIGPVQGGRQQAHPDSVPTTGRLSAPLLTLHNTGDLFVPISLEVAYRRKVDALGLSDLLVQRAIRDAGHCQFSAEEYVASWRDVVAWVREGRRPAGELLGADLSDVGREFTAPRRDGDPGGQR